MNSYDDDPRLQKMDPKKLKFLDQMSDELKQKKQVLPFLLAVTAAANERGISFSDEEAEMIIEHIYPNQTAEDQKRIQQLKMIAKMFGG
jgi:uncharacterized protein (UPF0216 family)